MLNETSRNPCSKAGRLAVICTRVSFVEVACLVLWLVFSLLNLSLGYSWLSTATTIAKYAVIVIGVICTVLWASQIVLNYREFLKKGRS